MHARSHALQHNIKYIHVRQLWNKSIVARVMRTFGTQGRPFVHVPSYLWGSEVSSVHVHNVYVSKMLKHLDNSAMLWRDPTFADQDHVQAFLWMDEVRAVGDSQSRRLMRAMIQSWIRSHKHYCDKAWSPSVIGERLSQWLQHFEFFGQSAEDAFLKIFYKSVWHQFLYLKTAVLSTPPGLPALAALKGILMYALAYDLPFEKSYKFYVKRMIHELHNMLLRDGFINVTHPDAQLDTIKHLINIRNFLRATHHGTETAQLQQIITRMVPPLRFFRHGDGRLSYLSGESIHAPSHVDTVLALSDVRGRHPQRSEEAGFERIQIQNNVVLLRTRYHPYPTDSSGNLQMEWSHRKYRLIKLCDVVLENKKGQPFLSRSMAHAYRSQSDDHVFMELKLNDIHHMHTREVYIGCDVDMRTVERIRLNQRGFGAIRFVFESSATVSIFDQHSVIIEYTKKEKYRLHFHGADFLNITQGSCLSQHDHMLSALFEVHANTPKEIKWSFSRL